MPVVLDTHTLIWYLTGNPRLGTTLRQLLEQPDTQIAVPTIVLAELKHLQSRKRVALSYDAVVGKLISDARCTIHPLDLPVLEMLPRDLELHDGIICATARYLARSQTESVKVATRDAQIIESGIVDVVW